MPQLEVGDAQLRKTGRTTDHSYRRAGAEIPGESGDKPRSIQDVLHPWPHLERAAGESDKAILSGFDAVQLECNGLVQRIFPR